MTILIRPGDLLPVEPLEAARGHSDGDAVADQPRRAELQRADAVHEHGIRRADQHRRAVDEVARVEIDLREEVRPVGRQRVHEPAPFLRERVMLGAEVAERELAGEALGVESRERA